ncbi:hypothetical protein BPOR_1084g00010 [Botrytis porri]|uniref:Uncharacterized protein n=1 Tax=Botrytis porri TaxID=87229 RepID=A0A4Z1K7H3_9HELO|nr:hypothetical protein BPOR_1084g00010 [Botrytis porri]
MSEFNRPKKSTDPTDPNKQPNESVSLSQIPIPSTSDSHPPFSASLAPSSPSSSPHAGCLSHSSDSPSAPRPSLPLPPCSLSLASLEVVLESESESYTNDSNDSKVSNNSNNSNSPNPPQESHTEPPQNSHTSPNEENSQNSEEPPTLPLPSSPTPPPLPLTIPLLAFTSRQPKSSTPLLDCGTITFTPEELIDASYDLLIAKVIHSIDRVLLLRRDEALRCVEWMGGIGDVEGSEPVEDRRMDDGIAESYGVNDDANIGSESTLTHTPLGNPGSSVGDVGLGCALRREKLSNIGIGALEIYGQRKSKGFKYKKTGREGGNSGFMSIREVKRIRRARERLEIESETGGLRVRGHVGVDRGNGELGVNRPIRRNVDEDGREIENNPQPNRTTSSLSPPTQSRTPLATLSLLSLFPKPKECTPTTLYIHWKPEPLIPAEYMQRIIRMDPIIGSSSKSLFHLSNPGDGDGDEKNLDNGADDVPVGDERNEKGEDDEEEFREEEGKKEEKAEKQDPSQTHSSKVTTDENIKITKSERNKRNKHEEEIHANNLTPLHPSFHTYSQFTEQFSDLYGTSDDEDDDNDNDNKSSKGIRELLRFLSGRGGRDELIVEYEYGIWKGLP